MFATSRLFALAVLLASGAAPAIAAPSHEAAADVPGVPQTVSFAARITDRGNAMQGDFNLTIALFDAETGGTRIWEEKQTLTADKGLVYATLGSHTPLTPDVLDGRPLFAELTVETDVLTPRIPVMSVPYAIRAGTASALEGFDPSAQLTGVTAGPGLSGGGTEGSVSLSVDTTRIQARVTGSCQPGNYLRAIAADGTVTCQPDIAGTGDITGVAAGTGLTGGGTSGDVSLAVDTTAIQRRVTGTCPAGQYIRVIAADGTVTCQADASNAGDITGVAAGTGLTGGGTTGDVSLAVDTTAIQRRVTGSCPAGQYIRVIAADGTVTCQADASNAGDITGVAAGTGLTGGGTSGDVSLAVDTTAIQRRVTGSCPAGQYIRVIAADGTVTCQADASNAGDITGVAPGAGLTGGGTTGDVSLAIANGGVTPAMLATGAVTAPALAAGAVGTAAIANGAVTAVKIANGAVTNPTIAAGAVTMSKINVPVGYAELTTQGAFFIYPSGDVNLGEIGSCMVTVQALDVGANAPFSVRPSMLNVASNITIQQPQFAFTNFSSGASGAGWQAIMTAVLTTNATGNWRFGCELQSQATPIVSCRVSWLCN